MVTCYDWMFWMRLDQGIKERRQSSSCTPQSPTPARSGLFGSRGGWHEELLAGLMGAAAVAAAVSWPLPRPLILRFTPMRSVHRHPVFQRRTGQTWLYDE